MVDTWNMISLPCSTVYTLVSPVDPAYEQKPHHIKERKRKKEKKHEIKHNQKRNKAREITNAQLKEKEQKKRDERARSILLLTSSPPR